MKKVFLIIAIVFVVLIGAIVAAPFIFKDDIKSAIDDAIAENFNANVYYDPDGLSLSLLSDFPNLTLRMENFGIAGLGDFENDTLLNIQAFEFGIDIMSVINGDQIAINSVVLDNPDILVLVLPEGQANYDIMKSTEETTEEEPESGDSAPLNISIKEWKVINADVTYMDWTLDFYTVMTGLDHSGSGDFATDVFDMVTSTSVEAFSMGYEGVRYLADKQLDADVTMSMDMTNSKYTFKENEFNLSDLKMGMDGYVSMPGDDIEMDISFDGRDVTVKSILSLIPGVYSEYLEGVTASGDVGFEGYVRGVYNDTMMPDVFTTLTMSNGTIRYADYPIPMEQINMRSELNVPGENMDDMSFDMPEFSMLIDGESLKANMYFANLVNYTWKFGMDGRLDLEKLMKIVPIEGLEMRGIMDAAMSTEGNMQLIDEERYDEVPAEGNLKITDFYVANEDLPQGFGIKSSEMTFSPKAIALKHFDATLGKSGMQLDGSLTNFIGFALVEDEVLQGTLNFKSNSFDLNEWMTEEEVEETEETTDTTVYEVIRIPQNIDFALSSSMKEILYDDLVISDLNGLITVKEGVASLDNVDFDLLEGDFVMSGFYNSVPDMPLFDFKFGIKDLSIPASYTAFNTVQEIAPAAKDMTGMFSTDFQMNGALDGEMMPVHDSLYGFGMVQVAEAAFANEKMVKGLNAITKEDKSEIELKDMEFKAEIKNGRMFIEPFELSMRGRKATVYGSSGISGADASIDYFIKTPMKTGQLGQAANDLISSFVGTQNVISDEVILSINVGGTYEDPKLSLAGIENSSGKSAQQAAKDAAIAAAKAELEKQRKAAEEKARAELEKQKKAAEEAVAKEVEKAKEEVNEAKEEVEKTVTEEVEKQKEEAKDKAKDLLKGLKKKKKGGGR